MKHIQLLMWIVTILIVGGVGYLVTTTMVDELENHPEITEIGGPPRLEYSALCALIIAIVLGIIMKLNKSDKEDEIDT